MRRVLHCLLALAVGAACAPAAASARTGSCLLRASGPSCLLQFGTVTYIADGDTVSVDIDRDGTRAARRIRLTGIQAMEQSTYPSRAAQRRGACHAVEATARLEQLLKAGRYKVRIAFQDPQSRSGARLRRALAVRIGGKWRDLGRILVAEGHALWLPNRSESAWNRDYAVLAERASRVRANLWNPDFCGVGPSETAAVKMWVNWDADGNDDLDPNGEWIGVKNLDPMNDLPLGGWWVRDSALRRYTFPYDAVVPAGGEITVYAGRGSDAGVDFYWNLRRPAFENVTGEPAQMGDGAYLFDPQGDLRQAMTYPCFEHCTDPAQGAVQMTARARGRESVQITNAGLAPIDLEDYRLTSRPHTYAFALGSLLQPGETMRVRIYDDFEDDRPLTRTWPTNGPILDNGGDRVELRTYTDIRVGCTAWGDLTC